MLDVVAVVQTVVQMEELSAARQALEGAPFAPGNLATLGGAHRPDSQTTSAKKCFESR